MSEQQAFDFNPKNLARRTDPATSHKAASEAESFRARHVATIYAALRDHGAMNKDEIAAVTGLDHVAVARRMKELADKELVRRSERTRPTSTGRQATVWEIVK